MIFSAAFGGAYGFVTGSRSENSGYDPARLRDRRELPVRARLRRAGDAEHAAALACARSCARSPLHNEALADRNWELKEAEERARSLFEQQGDLIVMRDRQRPHHLRQRRLLRSWPSRPREALIGTRFNFEVLEQGDSAIESNGTRIHDQKIATRARRALDRLARGLVRSDAGQPAELQCVGRDVTDRTETERALSEARDQADAANRAKSRFLAMA